MLNWHSLFFLASAIIAAISQGLLKSASLSKKSVKKSILKYFDFKIIIAYILLLCTTLLNTLGYRTNSLITAALISSSTYIFVGFIGVAFFKEKFTCRELFAYALIIAGAIFAIL